MIIRSRQDLGAYLQKMRERKEITQSDVASACGVTLQFVSKIERGDSLIPVNKIRKYARVLTMSSLQLFELRDQVRSREDKEEFMKGGAR